MPPMAKYYGVERSDEYLAHHGILGMKWGKRNPRAKLLAKKKRQKWLKGLKEDVKYATKSAGLSLVMGPAAVNYVNSKRAMIDPNFFPDKPKKRRRG